MSQLQLSPADLVSLAQMAYAENASEPNDVVKMTVQTALNRLRSGRGKEFGASMPDVLNKGYYAVKNKSPLYQQAVSGKFPDMQSKTRYADIVKLVEAIVGDEDYGEAVFYFTPEEEEKLRKGNKFNFKAVKPSGSVGKYRTYKY